MRTLSRFQADALLLLAATIWGFAFVAQKWGMAGLGPMGFVATRFALSALVVLPLALREHKTAAKVTAADGIRIAAMLVAFFVAIATQQWGMTTASVTNAGFLTALYVVFTPLVGLMVFRHRPSIIIWPACLVSLLGVYLLNGGSFTHFSSGDLWVIVCAAATAVQINLMGMVVRTTGRPFGLCLLQNIVASLGGLAIALTSEKITLTGIEASLWPMLYAGLLSGGVGFAIQAFAQQHTAASDAAVIMSSEALFAALAGAWLLHERLGVINWLGCGLIFAALLLVELYPFLMRPRQAPSIT